MKTPATPQPTGKQIKPPLPVDASPRARFQNEGPFVRGHQEMVDGIAFVRGADVAMLEYTHLLGQKTDLTNAAANGLKQQGALEFLTLFKRLGEVAKPSLPRKDLDNLSTT